MNWIYLAKIGTSCRYEYGNLWLS